MDVFITIDVEISSVRVPDWRETALAREIERDIFARTRSGEFGIGYQMDVMDACGLKGTFFLESLFACAVGMKPLAAIVETIRGRGHDVQLHAHPDWLRHAMPEFAAMPPDSTICAFGRADQAAIIGRGRRNLEQCGAVVSAFRAGDFDANRDTLDALRANGIPFDSSVNPTYGRGWRLIAGEPLVECRAIQGVVEFPVTAFRTFAGLRPLQVCACSESEMESALDESRKANRASVVMVLHSFELIKRPTVPGELGSAAPVRIRRFERLCDFLGRHRDEYRNCIFAGLDPAPALAAHDAQAARPVAAPWLGTLRRYMEQAADLLITAGLFLILNSDEWSAFCA